MTAPAGNETSASPLSPTRTTKRYNRIKLGLSILSSVLSLAFLIALMASGASRAIAVKVCRVTPSPYVGLLYFAAVIVVVQSLLTFPVSFISGFIVEHRYNLSNQSIGRWAWEKLKGALIGAPIGIVILLVLYYCMREWGRLWWLPVAAILSFFSFVLARLAPTLILPLFYKLTPLEDGPLKKSIFLQCARAGLRVNGIFQFNLSKNTKKANAAFTGIGKARRVILGDTLVNEFTPEEVETVFAHELGHYKFKHIHVGMAVGIVSTFVGLYITSILHAWSLPRFGVFSILDYTGLPLLGLWLALFGIVTSPLGNILSRYHERQADRFAVTATGKPAAFVSALRKLASMNLADPEPHPLVEFLFYSHPSIGKRIRLVESQGV